MCWQPRCRRTGRRGDDRRALWRGARPGSACPGRLLTTVESRLGSTKSRSAFCWNSRTSASSLSSSSNMPESYQTNVRETSLNSHLFDSLWIRLGPSGRPPPPSPRSDLVSLLQQRRDGFERSVAWVEHADPMVGSVDGVGHEAIELSEVVIAIVAEQLRV